ncbi:MAG TPA: 50S ribosomal protein L11 methyltransferase [Vicinamibacterales bacterium]
MITSDLLEFHAFCLTDTGTRLQQYEAALARVVQPGDTVVDVGAGLGVLGALACRAGASRVYAIESSPISALGEEVIRASGLSDRITFIRRTSFDVTLPAPADVLVADVHAPFGLQESGLSALVDARERLLKPGGAVIPGSLELAAAPVEAVDQYGRHVDVWRTAGLGLDLSSVRAASTNVPHPSRVRVDDLLGPMTPLAVVDLARTPVTRVGGSVTITATRAGLLHGICGAVTSTLAPGITLRNAPGDSASSNFAHALFPLALPIPVEAGDRIELAVDDFDGIAFRWRVATTARNGHERRAEQSTVFCWPLSSLDLRRERDDYRPGLTARGRLEQELLAQLDGTRTAAALRTWLDEHGSGVLPSARARAALLKETIARCG